MFYVTLIGSGLVFLAAHAAAARPPKSVRWAVFVSAAFVVNFLILCISPLALWLTTGTLFVALVAWSYLREKCRWFLPYSVIAFAAGYALPVGIGLSYLAEAHEFQKQYPVESMADRVPEPRPEYRLKDLPEPVTSHWERLDSE
jgi:hypothetical protein